MSGPVPFVAKPPPVDSTGQVTGDDDTLVLSPGMWAGSKLIPPADRDLERSSQHGSYVPTVGQRGRRAGRELSPNSKA